MGRLVAAFAALIAIAAPSAAHAAARCDPLDPSVCLHPWPNDYFTAPDATADTGRRLALGADVMPRNRFGKPIDATDINRSDGFSPGNLIVTRVPGLDTPEAFRRTGLVPITDMARYADTDQPAVVLNARTGARHPIWAELDSNPADRGAVTLILRPARNFDEGERYVVALRRLRDERGAPLAPGPEFAALRDARLTSDAELERRRPHFEDLFATLHRAGIARDDLHLAWDFTVASRRSLTERALAIRDDAFRRLGDTRLDDLEVQGNEPAFVQNPNLPDAIVDDVSELLGVLPFNPVDIRLADGLRDSDAGSRRITGVIRVPCYLSSPHCLPGGRFVLGPDGRPRRQGTNQMNANVVCTVPRDPPPGPLRVSLYGHGLLGSAGEVNAGNVQAMGREHGFVFCATDWAGMSTFDVPNVLTILQDVSLFPSLVDRTQQGYLNFLYLGRWMIHPDGLRSLAAMEGVQLDTSRLYYDGNSQGGILSGGLTALAPDFQRAVLGVPGMNYSTLLRRSVDFDTYANGDIEGLHIPFGLYQNYPNELERPLILSLMQLLWDRGESNGYAAHMTDDPLPNTPSHTVLLHPAFGDHQVANVSAEVAARTIGARAHLPALYPGRSPDVTPLWGIPGITAYPFGGSAIVYWDTGPAATPAPPTGNVAPRRGRDPHSAPRSERRARVQKSEFLRPNGAVVDVCGGGPCYAGGFAGP
jgi:hypothetical protein